MNYWERQTKTRLLIIPLTAMRGNPANRTTFVTEKNFREDDLTGSCSFGNEYFVRFFLDEKTRKNKYSSDLVDKELN